MKDITFIRQEDIASVTPKGNSWEKYPMAGTYPETPAQALAARLKALIEARGTSARALSIAIGANVTYVGQIISGKGGMPSASKLHSIAKHLGTTTDYLVGKAENPDQPVSEVSFREAPRTWRGPAVDGIPVLGTGFCDDLAVETENGEFFDVERVLLEADHVIRMIERPPALWNACDAYAIYFHGTSMEPRYRQGDIGVVDPRRPPSPGDDVVVQITNGHGEEVITVLVKELVRATSAYVELRQYSPARNFRIPRRQIARLHRLCTRNELLGG